MSLMSSVLAYGAMLDPELTASGIFEENAAKRGDAKCMPLDLMALGFSSVSASLGVIGLPP
eukprot:CAMPEP_0169269786 /NCGR_PEP_ID=MMETSP1016-20121227/48679_1 /TAXON_ID=342587 /ORGANISM="Karlodinium micrum, Strain CCMP2283" /LENGTH=60 /DNA_ID=CAMNT_0009354907 /DNA_START=562 /DNA_END=741 /DNA_ORIENTATION=+